MSGSGAGAPGRAPGAGRHTPVEVLRGVCDPEIPTVTIADLGILREVVAHEDGEVEVVITPTYSGCPAMDQIRTDIRAALNAAGYQRVSVTTTLTPPWTTDWITARGREQLRAAGIAPPVARAADEPVALTLGPRAPDPEVACPRCGAPGRQVSRFGSTACRASYVCTGCADPFDLFKTL